MNSKKMSLLEKSVRARCLIVFINQHRVSSGGADFKTSDVMRWLGVSRPTALKRCEELHKDFGVSVHIKELANGKLAYSFSSRHEFSESALRDAKHWYSVLSKNILNDIKKDAGNE